MCIYSFLQMYILYCGFSIDKMLVVHLLALPRSNYTWYYTNISIFRIFYVKFNCVTLNILVMIKITLYTDIPFYFSFIFWLQTLLSKLGTSVCLYKGNIYQLRSFFLHSILNNIMKWHHVLWHAKPDKICPGNWWLIMHFSHASQGAYTGTINFPSIIWAENLQVTASHARMILFRNQKETLWYDKLATLGSHRHIIVAHPKLNGIDQAGQASAGWNVMSYYHLFRAEVTSKSQRCIKKENIAFKP